MPDLSYQIVGAESQSYAAVPTLLFKLRVSEADTGSEPMPIHSVVLRCQVRIEPTRRSYSSREKERLRDLFGTPERWGQTLRSMLWTHVSVVVPPFEGSTEVALSVPCNYDFSLATTKYFAALEGGELPLCFLFSGTIFYQTDDGHLQVSQISWEKEADFRLPSATWREMMDHYYPNSAWLCLRKDVFDRLDHYRSEHGLPTWEQTLERLLAGAEAAVTP
jgi:Family of unknown function (DUF6084)